MLECTDYSALLCIMRHEGVDAIIDDEYTAQGGWSIVILNSKRGKVAQEPNTLITKA